MFKIVFTNFFIEQVLQFEAVTQFRRRVALATNLAMNKPISRFFKFTIKHANQRQRYKKELWKKIFEKLLRQLLRQNGA